VPARLRLVRAFDPLRRLGGLLPLRAPRLRARARCRVLHARCSSGSRRSSCLHSSLGSPRLHGSHAPPMIPSAPTLTGGRDRGGHTGRGGRSARLQRPGPRAEARACSARDPAPKRALATPGTPRRSARLQRPGPCAEARACSARDPAPKRALAAPGTLH
jgi:hypothetical protein